MGASAEEVSASCQQVSFACSETMEQTKEMKNINNNLNLIVNQFN